MAGRSRHRRKLEPITLEELADTPGMSGFCSFLTRDPNTPVPALDNYLAELAAKSQLNPTTPVVMTPVVMHEKNTLAITTPVDIAPPVVPVDLADKATITTAVVTPKATPAITVPEQPARTTPVVMERLGLTHITTPVVMASIPVPNRVSARPYNIHRCILAQDGHSRSEQVLYDLLWRSAPPSHPEDAFRLATIPMKDLAALPSLQMTEKNLRIALQRLVEKLSIEEAQPFDPKTKSARVWRVFSYKSILERRRAASLEWVVRDKGVRFVTPPAIKTTPVVINKPTPVVMAKPTAVLMHNNPGHNDQTTPVVLDATSLLGFTNRNNRSSSIETIPSIVGDAISKEMGFVDDDAIRSIILGCRAHVSDATDEEIADFAGFSAHRIVRMGRTVKNPTGLLIDMVPKCFVGESFARYRRENEEQARRFSEATQDTGTP